MPICWLEQQDVLKKIPIVNEYFTGAWRSEGRPALAQALRTLMEIWVLQTGLRTATSPSRASRATRHPSCIVSPMERSDFWIMEAVSTEALQTCLSWRKCQFLRGHGLKPAQSPSTRRTSLIRGIKYHPRGAQRAIHFLKSASPLLHFSSIPRVRHQSLRSLPRSPRRQRLERLCTEDVHSPPIMPPINKPAPAPAMSGIPLR